MDSMQDLDPVETGEWVDSLRAVLKHEGSARATYLLDRLAEEAGRTGIAQPSQLNTPYVNTIPPERQERPNWDRDLEHRIRSIIRWNAVAIILRANKESSELGGHIASFQSAATLYDIGFGHFWHAPTATHGGDLIYMQGHSAPGIYARAFVEDGGDAFSRRTTICDVCDGIPEGFSYPCLAVYGPKQSDFHLN